MRKLSLIPILALSLLPPSGAYAGVATVGPADGEPQARAAATTAAGSARSAFLSLHLPERGAGLSGRVHVDAAAERLGFDFSFNPPQDGSLWARVWVGDRDGDRCTREVVLQGTSAETSSWNAHEADGTPIPATADYSVDTPGEHRLRFQLDRPQLPTGCVRAEWWEGDDVGPTASVKNGRPRRLFLLEGTPVVGSPRQLSLPWGETTVRTITVPGSEWMPSILEDLSLSLARVGSQPPAVSAESQPIASWDFWRDGPVHIELPVTPIEPWGRYARLVTTTADGKSSFGYTKLWIRHAPPTDWVGTLAGARLWRPKTEAFSDHPQQPTMTFVDGEWVHFARDSVRYPRPTCTVVSDRWNQGCHRYWYDAETRQLQVDDLQARVTDKGWWWQGTSWDDSYRVRALRPGATRQYHGTGHTLPCKRFHRSGCAHFRAAEVWLRKDGSYRMIRGARDESGRYESLTNSRLLLDPDAPGEATRTVPLGIFGHIADGEWRVVRFRLGNTVTRPD
jgi:hypothetical protein